MSLTDAWFWLHSVVISDLHHFGRQKPFCLLGALGRIKSICLSIGFPALLGVWGDDRLDGRDCLKRAERLLDGLLCENLLVAVFGVS